MVGVTGALASEALKTGAALKARQAAVTSADVDAASAEEVEEAKRELNAIKVATDEATMSVYLKAEVRAATGVHEKLLTKRAKQLSAGKTDRAAAAAVEVAQAAVAAGQKWVVLELDGIDGKGLQPLVQKVTKQTGLATIALSVSDGKVACLAAVPKDSVEALPANTWLSTVLAEVSGRGGPTLPLPLPLPLLLPLPLTLPLTRPLGRGSGRRPTPSPSYATPTRAR